MSGSQTVTTKRWIARDHFWDDYPPAFSAKLRGRIRKRDSFLCQRCRKSGWIVHHIDYDKSNTRFWNLVTLCKVCHGMTNWRRAYWNTAFDLLIQWKRNNKRR